MNATVEDTSVFAGLNSYHVNKRAAQWRSDVEKALAAPLVGKPHKLAENILADFSRQHSNPLQALRAWIEIADDLKTTLPGQGFFYLMPKICAIWTKMNRRAEAVSAAGRWRNLRGMFRDLQRTGHGGDALKKRLEKFVRRMIPLTMPGVSHLPLSKLARKVAMKSETDAESKSLLASLAEFLKTGTASGAVAIKLCSLVRKANLNKGCLQKLMENAPPGSKAVAMLALRAELLAQRDEHRKLVVPQMKARLALQSFVSYLGDAKLIAVAHDHWSLLDEPHMPMPDDEKRANVKERVAKHRKERKNFAP